MDHNRRRGTIAVGYYCSVVLNGKKLTAEQCIFSTHRGFLGGLYRVRGDYCNAFLELTEAWAEYRLLCVRQRLLDQGVRVRHCNFSLPGRVSNTGWVDDESRLCLHCTFSLPG